MSLNGILYKDSGNYSCNAKNFAGSAEATISLSVVGTISTTTATVEQELGTGLTGQSTAVTPTVTSVYPVETATVLSKTLTTETTIPQKTKPTLSNGSQKGPIKQSKPQKGDNGRKLAADEKSKKSGSSKSIKDLAIVEETCESAVLLWTADGLPNDAPLTVVYSPYGEDDTKRTEETKAGSGKLLLEGLSAGMRYSVCLIAKGSDAGKDPCIDFYTLDDADDSGQSQFFLIIGGIACVLIVPLIGFLLYKILALYCKGQNTTLNEDELGKESYVKFETISMKQRTLNPRATELWTRRPTYDSERLLLCSRSSIDSQMTYKSDSSRCEYLC